MSKTILFFVMIACLAAAIAIPCFGAQQTDIAVPVRITYTKTPPSITLNWTATDTLVSTNPYYIYRRNSVGDPWVQVAAPAMTDRSWTDTNVAVGTHYEYQLTCQYTDWTVLCNAYIYAGIEMPVVDNRGKLILMVDSVRTASLQSELTRLVQDLIGDGWQVIRHDVVAASLSPAQVKSTIQADYQADPTNVKQVLLFGHFPVYYSAPMHPDGHGDRAWPADAFYADMDGTWIDNSVTTMPSPEELQVGRIDMVDMPSFSPLSETDLLRRYLNKDHNCRTRQFTPMMKAMWCPNIGWANGTAYPVSTGGQRSFLAIMGQTNLVQDLWTNLYPSPYLLAEGDGGGTDTSSQGVIQTSDLTTLDPAVFTILGGSHFGEWEKSDNLMRAVTATANYGLTCGYNFRSSWTMHPMALGENIGFVVQSVANNIGGNYTPCDAEFGTQISPCYVALIGDPSLRLFMVAPPTSVAASFSPSGVDLSWVGSGDSVLGYYVYRSNQQGGPYTRVDLRPENCTT